MFLRGANKPFVCLFFNCIYSKGDADVKNRLLDSVGAEEGEMI